MSEFRVVPGYSNYEVNEEGVIRSISRRTLARPGVMREVPGRVLRYHLNSAGYPTTGMKSDDGRRMPERVHRVVALAFLGPCPSGHEVAHGDGNRRNFHVSNLRWATRAENMQDAVRHGTTMRGERCPASKLRKEWIALVWMLRDEGGSQEKIGSLLGVSRGAISNVLRGKTWTHAPREIQAGTP